MGDNGRMTTLCNIAASLPRLARERPDQIAIRCPGGRGANGMAAYDVTLSYAELDARSDAIAAGLALHGIGRGVRAVVMVRPSPEFFLLMFALFKAGAVPVLVDPGIDKRALKQCLTKRSRRPSSAFRSHSWHGACCAGHRRPRRSSPWAAAIAGVG